MKEDDTWQPMDISSLINYEGNERHKLEDRTPDYELFKKLYEDKGLDDDSLDSFRLMYEAEKSCGTDEAGPSFSPLFSEEKKERSSNVPVESETRSCDNVLKETEKTKSSDQEKKKPNQEDQWFNKGFKQGYDQGKKDGLDQGQTSAFETARQEGYDQGKAAVEKKGFDLGFQKGENAARAECDAKSLDIINSLGDICDKIENSWKAFVRGYENEIIELICKIAEKVVFAKVDIDHTLVRESILHALDKLPEPEEIVLNVSPEDYEYIEMIKEDFFEKVDTLSTVSVVSNPGISRGGCRIETSKAEVETDIESRLDAVVERIKEKCPTRV
ncbi:MAG: FliH/SctL family protein [Thermodesulfobacteriota bacterium]|nr:FliH/SctL family protein [Thermodesulfobacteriota bacterium]